MLKIQKLGFLEKNISAKTLQQIWETNRPYKSVYLYAFDCSVLNVLFIHHGACKATWASNWNQFFIKISTSVLVNNRWKFWSHKKKKRGLSFSLKLTSRKSKTKIISQTTSVSLHFFVKTSYNGGAIIDPLQFLFLSFLHNSLFLTNWCSVAR